jgi:hypothetical protein
MANYSQAHNNNNNNYMYQFNRRGHSPKRADVIGGNIE